MSTEVVFFSMKRVPPFFSVTRFVSLPFSVALRKALENENPIWSRFNSAVPKALLVSLVDIPIPFCSLPEGNLSSFGILSKKALLEQILIYA